MRRRKLLISIGALGAGGTAAFGTEAFTSVEAKRSVDVEVASDSSAFLAIEPLSGNNANQYVSTEDGDETVALDFDGDAGTDGSGVNQDAVTQVEDLFKIINQGTQQTSVFFEDDSDAVTFRVTDSDNGVTTKGEKGQSLEGKGKAVDINTGEQVVVGIEIDTLNNDVKDRLVDDVTIRAVAGGTEGNISGPSEFRTVVDESANLGTSPGFTSIQDAIDGNGPVNGAASEKINAGGTILVENGTFDESVTIDVESLTLEGPNAGIAGDSAERGSEAVITQGVLIDDADDVTLNGFTVEQDVAGQDGQESVVRVGEDLGSNPDRTFVTDITLSNNVITATPTTDDTLTAVGIEGAVDMAVTNNQITQTDFTGDLVGVGNFKSKITNLEISQNTIETQLGVQLGDSSGQPTTATISENTINSTQRAVTADEDSNLTIDGNSIGGIEGESFEGDEYQQITAFSGSEVTITNNDFTAGADTGEYVADAIDLDTNAILNEQGNTFDPDAEIDGGFIVPTSQ